MKIIFSGGGTLGPVTPLLAIAETIKKKYPNAEFLWVGTKTGPERELVEDNGIKFVVLAGGKFRRYFSFWNFTDIFKIIIGFFQSLFLLKKENPDLCISAGGFISTPLHLASWFLGIPCWIHQQDVKVGLSNKLMAPFAKIITTALEKNISDFSSKKTIWLGNPVRKAIIGGKKENALKFFKLNSDLPVVLAMGGGTGSARVNQLIVESVPNLKDVCQIIHLSGKERSVESAVKTKDLFGNNYHYYQFFTNEMKDAYAVADIVISRGGFGSLTEIAVVGKPAIVIPKPGHQMENVDFLNEAGAVILIDEEITDGNYLAATVKDLLADNIKQKQMINQLQSLLPIAKEEKILEILRKIIKDI